MIWVFAIGLVLTVCLYLCAPFFARDIKPEATIEIAAYREELRAVQARLDAGTPDPADQEQYAVLQDRLLQAAKTQAPTSGTISRALPAVLSLGLFAGTFGIYTVIGSPNFTPDIRQTPPPQPAPPPNAQQPDMADLIPQLEARLAEAPDDATGWYLYGRTLMLVERFDDGLVAYERAMELSDAPGIKREYESAKRFAAEMQAQFEGGAQDGKMGSPTGEMADSIRALDADDQRSAIEGMVESLRARLDDDPTDVEGWTNLLRSRKVLGQTEAAKADIAALRQALPDQADTILAQAGWVE